MVAVEPPSVGNEDFTLALDGLRGGAVSLFASSVVVVPGGSWCEWKGEARYFAPAGDPSRPIAWSYPAPSPRFESITGWLSFYPGRVECRVDGERVRPQEGGFYGGWVTSDIVGPFKGGPGTMSW